MVRLLMCDGNHICCMRIFMFGCRLDFCFWRTAFMCLCVEEDRGKNVEGTVIVVVCCAECIVVEVHVDFVTVVQLKVFVCR